MAASDDPIGRYIDAHNTPSPAERKQAFFHGTTHDINVGDYIVPANQAGKSQWGEAGYGGQASSKHAFATGKEHEAWHFADTAGTIKRSEFAYGHTDEAPGRVRVHEVGAAPHMRYGIYNPKNFNHDTGHGSYDEYTAPRFRSKGTIDTKPGHQGTIPQLNWNQFGHADFPYHQDANHPTDEQIESGHERPVRESIRDIESLL